MKKWFFAMIITGVAVVFFAGGFLAGRFIEKPLYLYARVLELREDTLSVEAAYNDGPRRLYGQLELFISNPENARKARILDVEGKTILPEELPIGGIVHITFDGHIYSPEPHQRQIRNAYSIQIVDALPEAA